MTPPLAVFLVTLVSCSFVGMHSVWKFIVREQLPSLVHAGMTGGTVLAAWQIFQGDIGGNPMLFVPSTPALSLCLWSVGCALTIHLYELKQRNPYSGLFTTKSGQPFWRGKTKPKK